MARLAINQSEFQEHQNTWKLCCQCVISTIDVMKKISFQSRKLSVRYPRSCQYEEERIRERDAVSSAFKSRRAQRDVKKLLDCRPLRLSSLAEGHLEELLLVVVDVGFNVTKNARFFGAITTGSLFGKRQLWLSGISSFSDLSNVPLREVSIRLCLESID
jgi:hypothetical protein